MVVHVVWLSQFQKVQNVIFAPYLGKFIHAYLDDVCVYGTRDSHLGQLRAIFERLSKFKGRMSLEKCNFSFEKATLLGHVVF